MSDGIRFVGKDPAGNAKAINTDVDGNVLTKPALELYGATTATRPLATAVQAGTIFYAIDSDEVSISNGTTWAVI